MTRVSIDDQVAEMSATSDERLGDVVQAALSSLPPNRIVREILMDGIHIPKHQKAQALNHLLGEIKEVQIRTADKAIWEANGLDMALSCAERIQRSLIRAAELFREDDKAEANRFFGQCMEGLERFLETILITRCALNLDFTRINIDGLPLSQVEQEFSTILETILTLQEKQDFVALGDIIDYELITNLYCWAGALKQLRRSFSSNA